MTRLVTLPALVLLIFNFAILFHLCTILYIQPYEDKYLLTKVITNDLTYLILNYHLILFTDFVDSGSYAYIANSFFCVICANVSLNLLMSILPMF